MAIPSTSPSRSTKRQSPKPKVMKHQSKKSKVNIANQQPDAVPKRTKCPGVRLIGGRIYDSENGKTCHQCRQKTMDFTAACQNEKNGKQCTIRFCHKCLLNRYGEKAEEKALLDNWTCPKCRGKCNCSFCMKKRGQKPTGILSHTAKATGFLSVSAMLDVRGSEYDIEDAGASPKKETIPNKVRTSGINAKKPEKRKHACLKETSEKDTENACNVEKNIPVWKISLDKETENTENDSLFDQNGAPGNNSKRKGIKKTNHDIHTKCSKVAKSLKSKTLEGNIGSTKKNDVGTAKIQPENIDSKFEYDDKTHQINDSDSMKEEAEVSLTLPTGIQTITVLGTELPSKDVGQALQFLEFCTAFGKVFNMKKGQAESIIREIVGGRERRRAQYSAAVQFQMELISLIQKDSGEKCTEMSPTMGKKSWLLAAWKCISNSKVQHTLTDFTTSSEGYDALDCSRKLMLLNFLCDEALDTETIRSLIEEEYAKSLEQEKHSREKVTAAKEKERVAKRKMQDELAKAIIAKNGAPLTISEHDTIVSQIKTEVSEARAQILEAKAAQPNKGPRSDAVRTEPLFVDTNGNAFWRLKACSGELGILLQEMAEAVGFVKSDHWLAYDDAEQINTVEKYISSRKQKIQQTGN